MKWNFKMHTQRSLMNCHRYRCSSPKRTSRAINKTIFMSMKKTEIKMLMWKSSSKSTPSSHQLTNRFRRHSHLQCPRKSKLLEKLYLNVDVILRQLTLTARIVPRSLIKVLITRLRTVVITVILSSKILIQQL